MGRDRILIVAVPTPADAFMNKGALLLVGTIGERLHGTPAVPPGPR